MVTASVESIMLDEARMQLAKAILEHGSEVIPELERAKKFNRLKVELNKASNPAELVRLAQEITELGSDEISFESEAAIALKAAFDAYDEEIQDNYRAPVNRPMPYSGDGERTRNGLFQPFSPIGRNKCPMCPGTKKMNEETCFLCWAKKNPDMVDECSCGNTKKIEYELCTPCHNRYNVA